MNKIGQWMFPETQEEADSWRPALIYTALHSRVLFVAKTRIEGMWCAYCVPVPGLSHDEEKHLWENEGVKLSEKLARAAFGCFEGVTYAK
jgi:hypothetical protein